MDLPRLVLLSEGYCRDGDRPSSTIPLVSQRNDDLYLMASSRAIAGGAYSQSSPLRSTTVAFSHGVAVEFLNVAMDDSRC